MKETIEKMKELQEAVGATQKQSILKKYENDQDFCQILYYALNPMLSYKISEQTMNQSAPSNPNAPVVLCNIYTICETLAARKALDDATVAQVCVFLDTCEPCEREFYKKLLARTLRLGVTAKTVNKVIRDLIPQWEVQQAYPIEQYPLKANVWFALTQKLNGVRATFYNGKLYARSGAPFEGLDHITDILAEEKFNGMVFDGELTLLDKGNLSDNEAFRKSTGIINSDQADKTCICYTIFDVVNVHEFENNKCLMTYKKRRAVLDGVAGLLQDAHVKVLPLLYAGTDQSKIPELLDQMVREDKEGLMVNLDVPYKRKRHNGILKVKRFYTMDLPIVECEEGSGRLEGTLGAFVLDFKGNRVRVGSGFSDDQRMEYWNRRDELAGMLCEVKYKEISGNIATGAASLQFPIFVSLRTDKNEVSYG